MGFFQSTFLSGFFQSTAWAEALTARDRISKILAERCMFFCSRQIECYFREGNIAAGGRQRYLTGTLVQVLWERRKALALLIQVVSSGANCLVRGSQATHQMSRCLHLR